MQSAVKDGGRRIAPQSAPFIRPLPKPLCGFGSCFAIEGKKSVYTSLEKLKTDYLDLMLLHQPFSDYYGAYRALEELYNEGILRAIGVSNFYPDRLVDIASFVDNV